MHQVVAFHRRLESPGQLNCAGVVDYDVDSAKGCHGLIHRGLDLIFKTDVRDAGEAFPAGCFELFNRGVDRAREPGNLETLVHDIQEDGSTPVLMTSAWSLPFHYRQDLFRVGAVGYNNPLRYDRCEVETWGSPVYVRQGLEMHNDIVREVARSNGTVFIDQERLMGKDLEWFGDVVHLSSPGTNRFIRNIVDAFVAQGLL